MTEADGHRGLLRVDWGCPVNWSSTLNQGLSAWLLPAPFGVGWGSVKCRDLLRKYDTTLTSLTPATTWYGANRRGFGAVRFVPADKYLSFGGVSPLPASAPRPCSVVVVYRAASTSVTRHSFFNNNDSSNPALYLPIDQVSGTTYKQRLYSGGYVDSSNFTLNTTDYFIYGWTWDASNNVAFYLNGLANGTATKSLSGTTTAGARFGSLDGGVVSGFDLTGDLTCARFYTRVLSAVEMAALADEINNGYPTTLNRLRRIRYGQTDAASSSKYSWWAWQQFGMVG